MDEILRLPPQNISAECSVLGSCLRDNDCIPEMLLLLKPENFYLAKHQTIFATITAMFDAGKAVDLVTLGEQLFADETMQDCGGGAYLAELWDAAPTAANAAFYANIVRDKWLYRSLIHAGTEILRHAYEANGPSVDALETAEKRILAISELGSVGQTVSIGTVMNDTMRRIDARVTKTYEEGVPSGFVDLDKMTTGFHNGELILLAARPSTGKTALALAIARYVTVQAGLPVLFVSLEQHRTELGERLLCAQANVDGQHVRKGILSDRELDSLVNGMAEVQRGNLLHIDDTASQGITRIGANARRLKRTLGIRLVIIDYLQLIEPEDRSTSKYQQVSDISRRLKHMARELNLPVIALAQLNRESEKRISQRPRLADLRDSGSLEQDGDVILLLHGTRTQSGLDMVNVLVEKQRNGPTGDVPLIFRKATGRFENYVCGDDPFGGKV